MAATTERAILAGGWPAQTGLGVGDDGGERLVHFMDDRGRQLPHRRDAVWRARAPVAPPAIDPVKDGLVTRFNRPGGNAAGIRLFNADIVAKRLQFLHDRVPAASSVGFLVRSTNPTSSLQKKSVQSAAITIGLRVVVLEADEEQGFDQAFANLAAQKVDALLVRTDSYFVTFARD
jgi:ABC-type uncharacterized transport system substrate-binding protein